jgi:hypothetical protein
MREATVGELVVRPLLPRGSSGVGSAVLGDHRAPAFAQQQSSDSPQRDDSCTKIASASVVRVGVVEKDDPRERVDPEGGLLALRAMQKLAS